MFRAGVFSNFSESGCDDYEWMFGIRLRDPSISESYFLHKYWDLNSGSHACSISTLLTESSLHPSYGPL